MTDDGEGSSKKRFADSVNAFGLPNAGRPTETEMAAYASDPRPSATLQRIADQLRTPIGRFLTTPSSVKNDAASIDMGCSEQELRLLSAFGRINDRVLRDQVIALAEALVTTAR